MPPRILRLVLLVLVVAIVLMVVGYVLFETGGNEPGSGQVETITGVTTP